MKTAYQRYIDFEDNLLARYAAHPVISGFGRLSNNEIVEYLLQLGHLSSVFVMWYEQAKQGLQREDAKDVVRHILRDEIPRDAPTHQDDRISDLVRFGVPRARALNARPTRRTKQMIAQLFELTRYPQSDFDLRVMIVLRVDGELLVAEQYRPIVATMQERFGVTPGESLFYAPHFYHDQKKILEGTSHSDAFDSLLESMITDEHTFAVATEAAETAFSIRYHLLDQFTTSFRVQRGVRVVALATSIAAALLLSFYGGSNYLENRDTHTRGQALAVSEEGGQSYARALCDFYLDCDRRLATWARETGDLRYLAAVGTERTPQAVWGPGP